LIDGTEGSEVVHYIGLATERSYGESAADDFAESGKVGRNTFDLLYPACGYAEAGHDFVEY